MLKEKNICNFIKIKLFFSGKSIEESIFNKENFMKKIIVLIILVSFSIISCSQNKHKINVKKDFEYLYSVVEKSFLMAVEGVKKRRIDKSLDAIEKYIKQEEHEIKMVGVRLNSIVLKEQESFHIIRYNEKYTLLADKYLDYLAANFNPTQKDRFVTVVVEGIALKFMNQLKVPTSSTDFFKKAIR